MQLDLATIPRGLRERPQWVLWRYEERDGKKTKVPYQATNPKARAESTNPETWATFNDAAKAFEAGHSDGVGFVFSADDPCFGVDIDSCIDAETGEITDQAAEIVRRLHSYTELSPSGTGLHIIGLGSLEGLEGRRKGKVEMYDRGRYFTMTGHEYGSPRAPSPCQRELDVVHEMFVKRSSEPIPTAVVGSGATLDDNELLGRIRASKSGPKFDTLWSGDTSGYSSHSEADFALVGMLRFWTQNDAERIDALFRQSGLMREKWDEKRGEETYGAHTIQEALDRGGEVWEPARKKAVEVESAGGFERLKAKIKTLPADTSDALEETFTSGLWSDIAQLSTVERGIIFQNLKRQSGIGITDAKSYVKDSEGGEVSPNDLRDVILETWQTKGTYVRYISDWQEWYIYQGGVYAGISEEYVYKIADEVLEAQGHRIREHFLKDVIAKLSRHKRIFLPEAPNVGNTINLQNGILDIDTLALTEHTPDYISFAQSPAHYDPKAECPEFQKFLDLVLPNDRHQWTLREYSGYSLTPYNNIQVALYLFGPGARGKGTFVRVLEKLFGDGDRTGLMANLTIQELLDGSPALVTALNKRLIYVSEADKHASLLGFKKITGQDKVFVNPKYKTPYQVRLNTKIIISANVFIHTGDDAGNDSIDRRLAILPFVTDKALLPKNTNIHEAFTTPEELSGVLNWCLSGWADVKANGSRLTYGGDESYRKDMLTESNPVIMFLEENYRAVELELTSDIPTLEMYEDWRYWAEGDNQQNRGRGFKPGNIMTFTQRLKNAAEVLGWKVKHEKRHGKMYWRGIGRGAS